MQKIVMTREIRREWYNKRIGATSLKRPKFPFCSICSRLGRYGGAIYLKSGEEVYLVEYPNGTHGYYHVECMNNPKTPDQQAHVERIKILDIDHWRDIDSFIKGLVEKKLGERQTIEQIVEQFECSYTTAWRRLRAYQKKFP